MGSLQDKEKQFDKNHRAPEEPTTPTTQIVPPRFKLVNRKKGDLKTAYRPQKFEELAPTCSIEQLQNFVDNPNSSRIFLFEGRTGTGKTTCARMIAKANVCLAIKKEDKPCLECKNCKNFDSNSVDVLEINIADKRKIEDARQLVAEMAYRPQFLNKKIYILDEVQQLTPEAQQVLLKHLEEPKEYIWVFLCTTNKQGLDKALIDRANTVTFHEIEPKDAGDIIEQVLTQSGKQATPEIRASFLENARGSVRALLNNIQSYIEGGYDPNKVVEDDDQPGVKEISKAILSKKWSDLVFILKKKDIRENSEKIRIGLESYFRGALLGDPSKDSDGRNLRFGHLLDVMAGPLRGPVEYNDLVLRCYKAFNFRS